MWAGHWCWLWITPLCLPTQPGGEAADVWWFVQLILWVCVMHLLCNSCNLNLSVCGPPSILAESCSSTHLVVRAFISQKNIPTQCFIISSQSSFSFHCFQSHPVYAFFCDRRPSVKGQGLHAGGDSHTADEPEDFISIYNFLQFSLNWPLPLTWQRSWFRPWQTSDPGEANLASALTQNWAVPPPLQLHRSDLTSEILHLVALQPLVSPVNKLVTKQATNEEQPRPTVRVWFGTWAHPVVRIWAVLGRETQAGRK